MRDCGEGGLVQEFALPPTTNSVGAAEQIHNRSKRVRIGRTVLTEAIDPLTKNLKLIDTDERRRQGFGSLIGRRFGSGLGHGCWIVVIEAVHGCHVRNIHNCNGYKLEPDEAGDSKI